MWFDLITISKVIIDYVLLADLVFDRK